MYEDIHTWRSLQNSIVYHLGGLIGPISWALMTALPDWARERLTSLQQKGVSHSGGEELNDPCIVGSILLVRLQLCAFYEVIGP